MGTKKEHSAADVGHLAPFFLGEVHLVGGTDLLDAVEGIRFSPTSKIDGGEHIK